MIQFQSYLDVFRGQFRKVAQEKHEVYRMDFRLE